MKFPVLIVDGAVRPTGPPFIDHFPVPPDKMKLMANLTLVYGLRLLPEGEVSEINDATLKLKNGHEAQVTMHVLEGSRVEIEKQLRQSLDAFFDFYPEI